MQSLQSNFACMTRSSPNQVLGGMLLHHTIMISKARCVCALSVVLICTVDLSACMLLYMYWCYGKQWTATGMINEWDPYNRAHTLNLRKKLRCINTVSYIVMWVTTPVVGQTEQQVVVVDMMPVRHLDQKHLPRIGVLALTPFEGCSFLLAKPGTFSIFVNLPPACEYGRGEFR